tara:strand:+ start:1884 stop:2555 length:672 start_codon:yes stop_codon:yes gene_type:complete
MNKLKIITIILARKGSRRLKNKNLKKINGKKLFEITINFAKKLNFVKDIIVSSDDKRIIKICKKEKILTPGLRPKKLSGDKITSEAVAKYLIKWYEKKFRNVDGILLLQPTTPYRNLIRFKKAYKLFSQKKVDIIGVSKINRNPANFFYFNQKKVEKFKYKKSKKLFLIDGSMYFVNRKTLFNSNTFVPKNFYPMVNEKIKFSIDIDYLQDLKLANLMYNENF